ncbi:MAG: hypothetical protein MUE37_03405 [Bacteroidales bacterium]|nr:hypothetical protein [Bacteroidales bacterium]
MKKSIVILCICLFSVSTIAQEKFSIPSLTDQEKYNTAVWQWNAAYVLMVYYAKSMGITVEEAGATVGEMAKMTWGKEVGFEDFVNSILRSLVVMTPSGKVEITGQSDNNVKILITDFYKPFELALKIYGITTGEISRFYKAYISQIAKVYGIVYEATDTETGMIVNISIIE